jgi:hypothetical protein
MRSNAARAALGIALVALAVVLFVVLQDDGSADGESASTGTTQAAGQNQDGKPDTRGGGDGGGQNEGEKPAEPKVPVIVVKGGKPVGGVQKLEFTKGDVIRFTVRSDVADHVHLHGYDVSKDVPAGGSVTFAVPADLDGLYEVELEDRVEPLAEITVNPS